MVVKLQSMNQLGKDKPISTRESFSSSSSISSLQTRNPDGELVSQSSTIRLPKILKKRKSKHSSSSSRKKKLNSGMFSYLQSLLNPFSKRRYYFKKQKHAPPRNQFDKEPNRYPMPDDYITMSNMQLDPNELMLVLCITSDKKV